MLSLSPRIVPSDTAMKRAEGSDLSIVTIRAASKTVTGPDQGLRAGAAAIIGAPASPAKTLRLSKPDCMRTSP